jgi:hypothetical protein
LETDAPDADAIADGQIVRLDEVEIALARFWVPSFVLEWWQNGAPDGMKLGTLMGLLFRVNL